MFSGLFRRKKKQTKLDEQRNILLNGGKSLSEQLRELAEEKSKSLPMELDERELPPGWESKMRVFASQSEADKWKQDRYYQDGDLYNYKVEKSPLDYDGSRIYRASSEENEYPKKLNVVPVWVERYVDFTPTVWELGSRGSTGAKIFLVTYAPYFASAKEPPFLKIVFVGRDGIPFKQMANLVRELAQENINEVNLHGTGVAKPYTLTLDGKARDKSGRVYPNEFATNTLVDDLYVMYEEWFLFPDVDNFSYVARLASAWKAVQRMEREEKNKTIRTKIEGLRNEIKNCQKKISQLEKDENEIYEAAADGMNLLEENSIDPKELSQRRSDAIIGDIDLSLLEHLTKSLNLPTKGQYALAP